MHCFAAWRQAQLDAHLRQHMVWATDVDLKHAKKMGLGSIAELNAKRQQEIIDTWSPTLPEPPSAIRMRTILKAHQIGYWRGVLENEEEERKVLEHPIQVGRQEGTIIGVQQYYRTAEWIERAFTESDLAVADGLAKLAAIEDRRDGYVPEVPGV